MKYANFRLFIEKDEYAFAIVDECRFFTKKKVSIFKPRYSSYWRRMDTGAWLPTQIELLEEAYKAKQALNKSS